MTTNSYTRSDSKLRPLCYLAVGIAILIFSLLFSGLTVHFWAQLAISVTVLCGVALIMEREPMLATLRNTGGRGAFKTISLGLASAALLYFIFMLGNHAARVFFTFGGAEINAVYGFGPATPRWLVAFLLIFVVGPGEEFFWRGYVQRRLVAEFGRPGLVASVLAYGGAHVMTGNLMLILAALTCGSFWAFMYHRYKSMRINMISHACWAAAIFVLFRLS
ncbi:MAG: type II CAAX endopeptidase family protein [bacterium]